MSDLSQASAAHLSPSGGESHWPTPNLPGYPSPTPLQPPPAVELEGLNGRVIEGQLASFDPAGDRVQLTLHLARRPMVLRLDQFRRLRLKDALPLAPATGIFDLMTERPTQTFSVAMKGMAVWEGVTVSHQETEHGLFLFVPEGAEGAVVRWFVPRAAYTTAEIGHRIGETLMAQESLTPDQLQAALAEQEQLRGRRLGDLMIVRQLITPEDLAQALAHQAKMPLIRIGEALTALGLITEEQLQSALVQQRSDRGTPLGELLVRKGLVTRDELQMALARKMGYPMVDVRQFPVDTEAVSRLPYAIASRLPALPLMMRAGRLVVAVEDPANRPKIDEIEFAAQCKAVPVLAPADALRGAIERAYEKVGAIDSAARPAMTLDGAIEFEPQAASALAATMEATPDHHAPEDTEDAVAQSDNTLVRLINSMILEAHNQGVSDVHIECAPGKEKVRIRFRRDGHLKPFLELPPNYRNAVIARLKVMCDLDISERRKPQDGKINFGRFVPGVSLELRVATIPTHSGLEDAVIRLLAANKAIPMDRLGLSPNNLAELSRLVERPYGMVLCVGPTGSGKTTTLHSVLGQINRPESKIWTAEDPIEITQPGVRQVQVNPRIEWTFAKALRAFLRADPDVIMVGEIRDHETAHVAIEASLTGHLLLSTLHTNSAPETVTRLLDMGMDPFNFADALLGVLAQRLVRRLCTHCRQPHEASPEEEEELLRDYLHVFDGVSGAPEAPALLSEWRERFGSGEGERRRLTLYRPVGCSHCGDTGYRGRAGIHELMTVTRTLRHLIQTGTRADDLLRQSLTDGLRTLRQDGIEKVLAGVTTIEEVRANS